MSPSELNSSATKRGMDKPISVSSWRWAHLPPIAKVGLVALAIASLLLAAVRIIVGPGESVIRVSAAQIMSAPVEQAVFHDLVPVRARVEPLESVYIDAVVGGRVERVLVESGDLVEKGQPMIELSNTNLALSIIQQESQLNQAISQLQQNEIALEQNALANERSLAEIEYRLVNVERSAGRRGTLASGGAVSREQHDDVADELAYYKRLRPIQADSNKRQTEMRERSLPEIHKQLDNLRSNLGVVRGKLDSLIVRAPIEGVVTAIDLKVGEHRDPGDRLAEVTPEAGMKLTADIDEYYLARVRVGQGATVDVGGKVMAANVRRVSPQVRNGQFSVDFEFIGEPPQRLVAGETAQGRLQLGGDTNALVLPVGPFYERTGGDWVFVLSNDGRSAQRRQIRVGRRTAEQLEILDGLKAEERIITSDYSGLERADRIIITN